MEFTRDSLIIGEWNQAPIRIHWTVLICGIFFSRFEFVPYYWAAYFFLVFIHEAGHAAIIRYFELWTEEIVIHGLGGYCRWAGRTTEIRRALIAWGGVLAQLIIFISAHLSIFIFGQPDNKISFQIYHAFINTNLWIMVFNLIPIEPLDGVKAWKIIELIREKLNSKFKERKYRRQDKAVEKELRRIMQTEVKPADVLDKKIK